jgi:hypothetical protein
MSTMNRREAISMLAAIPLIGLDAPSRLDQMKMLCDHLNERLRRDGFPAHRCEWMIVRIVRQVKSSCGWMFFADVLYGSLAGLDTTVNATAMETPTANIGDLYMARWDDRSAWTLLFSFESLKQATSADGVRDVYESALNLFLGPVVK